MDIDKLPASPALQWVLALRSTIYSNHPDCLFVVKACNDDFPPNHYLVDKLKLYHD